MSCPQPTDHKDTKQHRVCRPDPPHQPQGRSTGVCYSFHFIKATTNTVRDTGSWWDNIAAPTPSLTRSKHLWSATNSLTVCFCVPPPFFSKLLSMSSLRARPVLFASFSTTHMKRQDGEKGEMSQDPGEWRGAWGNGQWAQRFRTSLALTASVWRPPVWFRRLLHRLSVNCAFFAW